MKILLRKAFIADNSSPFNGATKDILIDNGIIVQIADSISTVADNTVEADGLTVSPGWVDIFTHAADPGYEYRETLSTAAAAAAAGGYTTVFTLPDTLPIIQNKSQVEYIRKGSATLPVEFYPLGAITRNTEGKELAEMYDMHASGAIAFSDGLQPVQTSGLLLKALQYVKAFNGTIVQMPVDKSIGTHGLMNEGIVSTQLGLPGIPAVAEHIIIKRDLDLLRYTESKLHITGVTTAESIRLVKEAKAEGLQVTCSVTPYHLFFADEDLQQYDTNLKLTPPLRSRADVQALKDAVIDGTVDCIASHHIPHNVDAKICEFEYAKAGMIGLQTAFVAVNTAIPGLSVEKIVALFSQNARNIFHLPATNMIKENHIAELTLFTRSGNTTLTKANNKSASNNSAFMDKTLNGQVIGIASKQSLHLN